MVTLKRVALPMSLLGFDFHPDFFPSIYFFFDFLVCFFQIRAESNEKCLHNKYTLKQHKPSLHVHFQHYKTHRVINSALYTPFLLLAFVSLTSM